MIKFHEKNFIESIPFEKINPVQKRQHSTKFRYIYNIENKLTRFPIYHETKFAYKCKNPLYKTQ